MRVEEQVLENNIVFCIVQPSRYYNAHLVNKKEYDRSLRKYKFWISKLKKRQKKQWVLLHRAHLREACPRHALSCISPTAASAGGPTMDRQKGIVTQLLHQQGPLNVPHMAEPPCKALATAAQRKPFASA